jgi:hypothetical protein
MAAVLEPKDAAAKHDSQVDEQIAHATSRIRVHDAAVGGLTLAALALGYATAMILLDKYLVLPAWVRQVGFVGFVGVFAATAYLTLVRPLLKRINPLYAARRVEGTLDDPKNSVTGYVDARENGDLNATVKAALASRAAKAAAEADVNRAVDHRSLIWLGGVAVALFLGLIVLFFVFRPAQFASLAGRAFMPFSAGRIASRTELQLVKPEPADPTITTGQSVTVAVSVKGRVPKPDGPERVRLLVRHNPNDPNYDEVPMVPGNTSRDWEVRVPDHLVQNGFWYKVVGGDGETPEYKVTVRSLPRFDTFAVSYEYPKYLKRPPFASTDPVVSGPRGTAVTMLAKTNRPVANGLMVIEPGGVKVAGTPDASDPSTLRFAFKLADGGQYKLTFNAPNGERTAQPFAGVITVEEDRAPVILIGKPEAEETEEPANGQLKIDAKIGDDWGIDTVTLKMRTLGATARQLPDVPFLNGASKSFRREKDDTYPTDLDYKGSVDFAKLTKDAAGLDITLAPGTVVEFWLEATDNCTEPKPNVGVSAKKRVRLGEPSTEKDEKKNLDDQKDQRKNEEQQHNDQQQKRLDTEDRKRKDENKPGDKDNPEKKNGENAGQPEKKDGRPDAPPREGDPKKDNPGDKKGGETGEPMPKDGMPQSKNGDGSNAPKDRNDGPKEKGTDKGDQEGAKSENSKGDGAKGDPKSDVERTARELQEELNRENRDGASNKPNNTPQEQERPEPAKSKPQPKTDATGGSGASEPKPEPKADPAADKKDAPAENRAPPKDGPPGTDKPGEPQPKGGTPPKEPNGKQADPKSADAKSPDGKPNDANAGEAKPDKAPPAGGAKPQPKDGSPKDKDSDAKPSQGANDPKGPNETPAADSKPAPGDGKPQGKPGGKDEKKGNAGAKQPQPGEDKPAPGDKGGDKPGPQTAPAPKEKMDPEKLKDLQNAAKDLQSDDPKKQQDARDKLDKAFGEKERKELEKLGKDLQSKDEATRKAAEQKVKDAVEQAKKDNDQKADGAPKGPNDPKEPKTDTPPGAGAPKKGDMPDAGTPKEPKKDEGNAGGAPKEPKKDDPKAGGADKEPKEPTEQQKKDIEQALKDLKSDDPQKKAAAEKKLDDIRKKTEQDRAKKDGSGGTNDAKGKDPSPEELADLAKKAQDLQSNDEQTRQKAQQELDDKIGKDQRQKLEDAMKNQKPGDPKEDAEKLKEQLKGMAKRGNKPEDDLQSKGGGSPPANKRMDDPAERARSAQLNLEELKKDENRKKLQEKKGWTDAEYDKFLKDYEDHIRGLREEAKKDAPRPTAPIPKDPANPMFTPGGAGKIDAPNAANSNATGSTTTVAPPGFDKAREKFNEALKKKP